MIGREKSSNRVSYWCSPTRVPRVGWYLNTTSSKKRSARVATSSPPPSRFAGALLQATHSKAQAAANPTWAQAVWIIGAADYRNAAHVVRQEPGASQAAAAAPRAAPGG